MPAYRSLSLRRLITALNDSDTSLLPRYFLRMMTEEQIPSHLSVMDYDNISSFLETINNEWVRSTIYEDFRRINDICEQKASLLVWASRLFQIQTSPQETMPALAMRLFLDYPQAFEHAWRIFSLHASSKKVSCHNLPYRSLQVNPEKLEAFEKEIKKYFSDSAKGEECHVHFFDEGDQMILLVERGSYIHTLTYWENGEIKVKSYRPAEEDLLTYDRKYGQLYIQTPCPTDMEQYIRSFAKTFIGDPLLAERPDRDRAYVLDSIMKESFSWAGNEYIKSIVPVEGKLRIKGATEALVEIRSKDLRLTLEQDLLSSGLSFMDLIDIKFRIILETQGKEEKVTFGIAPSYSTDLLKKKHADIISAYLRENGVQLN